MNNDLKSFSLYYKQEKSKIINCGYSKGISVNEVVQEFKKHARKTLDVHLMIVNPERYVQKFAELGSEILTVHLEASTHLHRTVENIKNNGMKSGVAINPHTPVSSLNAIITDIDLVCLMSVNPGFGGQSFIENTYKKVEELRSLIEKTNSRALIEVDGGVNNENAKQLFDSGANVLVAGSSVFKSEDPISTISYLNSL